MYGYGAEPGFFKMCLSLIDINRLKGHHMLTKLVTTQKSWLVALGLLASSYAFANTGANTALNASEPIYHYQPAEVVKANIEAALNSQQIDTTQLEIQVDEKGVVNASGEVASRADADNITKIIQGTESVYAVFGKFVYPKL